MMTSIDLMVDFGQTSYRRQPLYKGGQMSGSQCVCYSEVPCTVQYCGVQESSYGNIFAITH